MYQQEMCGHSRPYTLATLNLTLPAYCPLALDLRRSRTDKQMNKENTLLVLFER
jgi:hypothetical protein